MSEIFDFLVIGGGIAGVTAAAELAPFGATLLLEREGQLAYHASGRSAAMFIESYGNPVVRALNRASTAGHRASGVLSPRAILLLGDGTQRAAFTSEAESFGLTRITVAEAQALFPLLDPQVVTDAGLREDVFELDTDLMIQEARRRARGAGAQIRTGAEVTAIHRDTCDTCWQVSAGDAVYRARRLVNAAGAWADDMARLAGLRPLGITPLRRSMAVLPLPEGLDGSAWPFVDAVGEGWYAKPQAGKLLVSPGDEDPVPPMDAWADDMVLAEGLARFEAMMTLAVTRVEHSWAGLRSFAPDRTLVIGPDAGAPDFLWLAGQGGYGFQTAPAAARLLADLALGRPPELASDIVAALSPSRFA